MSEAVAWAVVFTSDTDLHRMVLFKERARAEQYCGDPLKPHEEPKVLRPLVWGDDMEPDDGRAQRAEFS